MDILASLFVNEGIDKIDFNPYIHSDIPDKKILLELLYKHIEVFSPKIKIMDEEPFIIDIAENTDIKKQWAMHFSPPINEEIGRQVDQLLVEGLIRESRSPISFSVVPVMKPDGSIRVCVDYKPLNYWTLDVRYPLSFLDISLQKLSGKRFHAKLVLTQGFHQLRMAEDSKWLTAFVTLNGLYEWNVLPFGVKNGPAIYQKTIRKILVDYEGRICIVFIDDKDAFGDDWEEFLTNLDKVLTRLEGT